MKLHEVLEDLQITEEDKSGFKQVKLVRIGGLTATPHDDHVKNRPDYFHTPSNTKGIFVFMSGYEDRELYAWKFKTQKGVKRKEFSYKGKIWTHIKVDHKDVKYYRTNGTWYETDTNSLRKIFTSFKKPDRKPEGKSYGKKPFYELFIEKQHTGGI